MVSNLQISVDLLEEMKRELIYRSIMLPHYIRKIDQYHIIMSKVC